MKSEHRHELQTNELGKVVDSMGGVFERYGNQIMIAVCAVSIVASGIIYWVRRSHAQEANAWTALSAASGAEEFADVADRYKSSTAAPWARLTAAESRLTSAIQLMFTDREAALLELKGTADRPKCLENLQALSEDRRIPGEIRERALFSLARCQETISDGNEAAAIKTYETLLSEFPETVYKGDAEKSIAELRSGSAQEFYAWFAKQNPKPAPPPKRPADQAKGSLQDEDFELPPPPKSSAKKKTEKESEASKSPAAPAPDQAGKTSDASPKSDQPGKPDEKAKSETPANPETKPAPEKDEPAKEEPGKSEAEKKDAPDPAP